MVRPMRKTRAPTQSQRAIGHIAALQSIATMFVMHAMVGRSTLQFKMPRLDAYPEQDWVFRSKWIECSIVPVSALWRSREQLVDLIFMGQHQMPLQRVDDVQVTRGRGNIAVPKAIAHVEQRLALKCAALTQAP